MSNKVYLTNEGFLEIEEELNHLKEVKRPEVIKALKDARALGDLSENADYDAARNEQAQVEGRIKELELLLEKAELIEKRDTDKVSLGAVVKIKYIDDDEDEDEAAAEKQSPDNNKPNTDEKIKQILSELVFKIIKSNMSILLFHKSLLVP